MNRKTKTRMLVLSVVFLALGATVTFASSNNDVLKVHTILNNAIQDIQKIYFSSGAVKDVSHPEYEIPVLVQNGSVSMGGRMLMTTSGANNVLAKGSTGSSLFQGKNNILSGVDSYIVAGSGNKIYHDVTGGVIIGGTENMIYQGEKSYILGGSNNIIWSGNNSFIIGGKNGQITGNNSYIFMGNGSNQNKSAKINANNVVTFGKNVNIDKDNVFLWRDHSTTDEKSATKENTFIMFAKNGLNVLKNSTSSASFIATGAVKVEGSLQLSGEEVRCGKSIGGAVQYTGGMYGCFCGCNGTGWVSLVPSDKCRDLCPKITGRSYEDGKCIEVPAEGLESLENNDSSCDEGIISGYNQVDVDGFPVSWTWECIGDNGSTASCSANALSVAGKCFEGEGTVGEGDRYHCFKGKVTNEKDQNNKYTWDCEPINKPKEGNTEKCAVCHNGYAYMEDSETCERTTETKCINEGDDKFLCTNGGTASGSTLLKVSGVVIGGKWNCVSPTGGTGENGCHWCDSSKDYEWSGGANNCVLKKKGVCANNPIPVNNSSAWCTIGSVEVVTQNHSTQSYAWYCKGENAGDDVNFKSNLCTYCANGGTYNTDSGKCEVEDTDYCGTKGVHHVGNNYIVSNGTQCMTIADKNVGATSLGGVGKYYKWGSKSASLAYPINPDSYDCEESFFNCLWGEGGWPSPCGDGYTIPSRNDWELLHKLWSESDSSLTFDSAFSLPSAGYYESSILKENGVGYYRSNNAVNPGSCGGVKLNPWTTYRGTDSTNGLDGENWGVQVRCFGEGDHQQSTDIPEDPDTFQGEWACLDGGDVSGTCGEISSSLFCDKFKQKYRNTCYIMDGHGIMQFRHDGGACDACVYTPPSYCNSIPSNKPMPPECSVLVPLENNCSTKTDAILCEKTYSCGWFHNGAVYDFPTEPVCIDPVTKEELSELECDPDEEPDSCEDKVINHTPTSGPEGCTYNGNTYAHGQSIDVYLTSTVSCMSTSSACTKQTVKCEDGTRYYNGINVASPSSMSNKCSLKSMTPTGYSSNCGTCGWTDTATAYKPNDDGTACVAVTVYKCKTCSGGGGGGGGGGCFLAGTKVLTKEGSKNIEEINVGDIVLSYNTRTNQNEYNRVLEKMVHENNSDDVYTLTINGNTLDVTELHKFYLVGNIYDNKCSTPIWRSAIRLREGDILRMVDGEDVIIENITHRSNYGTVYNLQVENNHNYYVDKGYLVHNSVSLNQKSLADEGMEVDCGPYTVVDTMPLSTSHCNSCDGSCETTYY